MARGQQALSNDDANDAEPQPQTILSGTEAGTAGTQVRVWQDVPELRLSSSRSGLTMQPGKSKGEA